MELLLFTIAVGAALLFGVLYTMAKLGSRVRTDHSELGPWRRPDADRPEELAEPESLTRIRLGLQHATASTRIWHSLLERMDSVAELLGEDPDRPPPQMAPPPRRWYHVFNAPRTQLREDGQPEAFHEGYLRTRLAELEALAGTARPSTTASHQNAPDSSNRNGHR